MSKHAALCQREDQWVQNSFTRPTRVRHAQNTCLPIRRAPPLTPQSPYSASKIGADAMALSFSIRSPPVVVRPSFHTYGPLASGGGPSSRTIRSRSLSQAPRFRVAILSLRGHLTFVKDTVRVSWQFAGRKGTGEGLSDRVNEFARMQHCGLFQLKLRV